MTNLTDDDKRWVTENLKALETRMENRLIEHENRLIEHMRAMQTELLRGFAAFSEGMTLRLRKVEAD